MCTSDYGVGDLHLHPDNAIVNESLELLRDRDTPVLAQGRHANSAPGSLLWTWRSAAETDDPFFSVELGNTILVCYDFLL